MSVRPSVLLPQPLSPTRPYDRLPQRPFDREVGANVLRFQDDFPLAHCAVASFCANSAARKQRTLCLSLTGVNCGVS